MADNNGDNFNGYIDMETGDRISDEELLERAYAQHDAQAMLIQELQAQVAEAQQMATIMAGAYKAVVEALGYDWAEVESGKITHADIIKYAKACDAWELPYESH